MMIKRRSFNAMLGAGLGLGAATRLAPRALAQAPFKAGFVYVGPIGDFGWSYQHDRGRLAVERNLGAAVSTSFVEKVPEGADAERVIRELAATEHGIIFTTSFGFWEATLKVAREFPDVKFEHATGYKRDGNVATYNIRFYEGRYIQGVIAGRMSKSGIVGYIGSIPIPEVVMGVNAFMLGLRSINPQARIKLVMINAWYDPGKEADAAKALIDQGADIIAQHTDSAAPLQVAEQRGIKGFGQASDMIQFGPKAQLTSSVDYWDDYYTSRVKAAMTGSWVSGDVWGGLASGMLRMAPYTNMPDDVAALAATTEKAIKLGTTRVFAGPLRSREGGEKAAAGVTLDDGAIAGMDWLLEGVDGDLPR